MKNNFISSIWDFTQTSLDVSYPIHDFFRWYGKLPQQLVRKLIQLYSKKNDLVLSNFAGSGTILFESNLAKRRSVGIDSNPLSYLICKVKTNPTIPKTDEFLLKIKRCLNKKDKHLLFDIPQKEKWFYKESLIDLQYILNEIRKIKNEKKRNFYLLALAKIIRKISKTDSRCVNHIIVDKNKPKVNVFKYFSKSVRELEDTLRLFKKRYNKIQTEVFIGDARNLDSLKDNSIDLIISHPPYFGAILYYNIYRLVTDLLGYSYDKIKLQDISTNSLKKYFKDMKKVFDEMYRVLKPNKYGCIIIGDVRRNGKIVPLFSNFIDYCIERGFLLKDIFIWVMGGKAGMNVARRGNYIDHNYILVFQKKG